MFISYTIYLFLLLTILGLEHVETCVQFHHVRIFSHPDAIYRPAAIHVFDQNHSILDAHRNHPIPWLDLYSILVSSVQHESHNFRVARQAVDGPAIESSWRNSELQWRILDARMKRNKSQREFLQIAIDLDVGHLEFWTFRESALQTAVEPSLEACTNANPMIQSVVVSSHVPLPFDSRKGHWVVLFQIPLEMSKRVVVDNPQREKQQDLDTRSYLWFHQTTSKTAVNVIQEET